LCFCRFLRGQRRLGSQPVPQTCSVARQTRLQRTRIQPGPEPRNDLSLSRNDAFATITRSMLPVCPFASPQRPDTDPFDPGLSAHFGSEAEKGEFIARHPLSAHCLRALMAPTVPTPPQVVSTFRIEAFDGFHHKKPASPDARSVFRSPPRSSFDGASDRRSKLRFVPLGYRSSSRHWRSVARGYW